MRDPLIDAVRAFVDEEVNPVALSLEHADEYPHRLVARMRELGLFGCLVPRAYGGLGLSVRVYAGIIEELCRGWMSLAGVINSHTMMTLIVLDHGTEEQRRRFLPRFASGDQRGGLCLTEPHAGSDVQAIRTVALRRDDAYVVTGTKMFVTNGREGHAFALLALTDPAMSPRHRGMSCFIVEKGHPGLRVAKSLAKLGYKGVDTAELVFDDVLVPAANLVGGREGRGFAHVMSGLEAGRINIAARCVGVAQAAYEASLRHCRAHGPDPALADIAARVTAARVLTSWAADMKDRGDRCDLEAGMAKLYASESAQHVAGAALRIHGAAGQLESSALERHYRDTPLMIIGEGTNEIQRTLIARQLLERYGERPGALLLRDEGRDERRAMVLAVRQFVDKEIAPVVADHESAARYPDELVARLAELGIFGALIPAVYGGLALDAGTAVMIVEEVARGSATLASIVVAHLTASSAIARFATPAERERLLPPMSRAEMLGAVVTRGAITAGRTASGFTLSGAAPTVELAAHAAIFVVPTIADDRVACFLVPRDAEGVRVDAPLGTIGTRGLERCDVVFRGARVAPESLLGGDAAAALTFMRLGTAATAVGVAQAAFEAALRYSRERVAFGKPICQHQAIQLKLADMATWTTAARLLTSQAADAAGDDAITAGMARIEASETAAMVTLEAMRIHGGYGYVSEFPVERYYRDAIGLVLKPLDNARERADVARMLASPAR